MAKVGIIPLIDLPFPGYPQGRALESSHMKIVIAAFVVVTGLLHVSPAFAQLALPADTKAISDCLKKADDGDSSGSGTTASVLSPIRASKNPTR